MRSWIETVTFLFVLISLLCIESEGVGSQNKHNHKDESEEYRMASANAQGSVDNSSSHDAFFGDKIGYNVVSYTTIRGIRLFYLGIGSFGLKLFPSNLLEDPCTPVSIFVWLKHVRMHLEANWVEALPIESKFESDGHQTYPFPEFATSYDIYCYKSAIYELPSNGAYFGAGGRFDIYGYQNLTADEIVSTAVWISGVNDANLEVIQAGWHVNQALYGDSGTRFFTRWTADGYVETGCYNTLCEGFVKVANAPLSPGQVLPISTPDEHHDLRIWIEKDHTEDWWLYASTESTGSGQIGYWPKSFFSRLAQNATDINFGGLVQAIEGSPSPPMGSGHFPTEGSAAYFANVEYVDQFGRKIAGILPSVVTNKNCYDVGDMKDAQFSYGGPGGCLRR